jgi:5-methylcytosine-specific restriction protein B
MSESKSYWFVGSSYLTEDGDQTERFLKEGIWQNGYKDKYTDLVRSIQVGDKIAIKSSYVRKRGLPFDNQGNFVSVMKIKAVGIVTRNHGDGQFIDVDWQSKVELNKEWYFYTNRSTIWRVTAGEWMADELINFTFNKQPQELDRFRNDPYWKERFGDIPTEKKRFKWSQFYEDLADKLLTYKDNRAPLVKALHEISNDVDALTVLHDQSEPEIKHLLEDICPFTVFALFNRGITETNRKAIAQALADFLGVETPVPNSFEGIPIVNNQRTWFFGYEYRRETSDIDALWQLFDLGISYGDGKETVTSSEFEKAYNTASKCWGVGWNITMGLYWIRPWKYLTLDGQSRTYITKKLGLDIGKHGEDNRPSSQDYLRLIDELETRFKEDAYPVHSFPELSLASWLYKDTKELEYPDTRTLDQSDFVADESLTMRDIIPKYDELAIPLLYAIKNGDTYLSSNIYQQIKQELGMDEYDHILLESTGKPLFDNRIAWAKSYLKKAELVEFPTRGHIRITDKGEELINLPSDILSSYKTITDLHEALSPPITEESPVIPYSLDDIVSDGCFVSKELLEGMLERLRTKKNIILQGPPGTGKTWLAKRLAFALMGQKNEQKLRAVQFHPNLSYEDFIRGWRPSGEGKLTLADGPFLEMINQAKKDASTKYVVVIEEINRGNPAQIFGEMLTLLEADKRTPDEALELSYRRHESEKVFVPDNLYVIGTMNIADRSLALVDFALRRRFAFIDLKPAFGTPWINWVNEKSGIDISLLQKIEELLLQLNDEISNDPNLGSQFVIGHSYVTPAFSNKISDATKWYKSVVLTEIGPLLDEYWFDNLERSKEAQEKLISGM